MSASKTVVGRRILLVEDDASVREAIQRLLGAAGFRSTGYGSAEALLADDAAAGADCVISDLRLPGMSGLELLAALRGRGREQPLILITAYDTAGQRDEALRCGAAAYLVKPFEGTELLAAISALSDPVEAG